MKEKVYMNAMVKLVKKYMQGQGLPVDHYIFGCSLQTSYHLPYFTISYLPFFTFFVNKLLILNILNYEFEFEFENNPGGGGNVTHKWIHVCAP